LVQEAAIATPLAPTPRDGRVRSAALEHPIAGAGCADSTAAAGLVQSVLAAALSQLGKPYQYAAAGPDPDGSDH
jgi:hypothetical protein